MLPLTDMESQRLAPAARCPSIRGLDPLTVEASPYDEVENVVSPLTVGTETGPAGPLPSTSAVHRAPDEAHAGRHVNGERTLTSLFCDVHPPAVTLSGTRSVARPCSGTPRRSSRRRRAGRSRAGRRRVVAPASHAAVTSTSRPDDAIALMSPFTPLISMALPGGVTSPAPGLAVRGLCRRDGCRAARRATPDHRQADGDEARREYDGMAASWISLVSALETVRASRTGCIPDPCTTQVIPGPWCNDGCQSRIDDPEAPVEDPGVGRLRHPANHQEHAHHRLCRREDPQPREPEARDPLPQEGPHLVLQAQSPVRP